MLFQHTNRFIWIYCVEFEKMVRVVSKRMLFLVYLQSKLTKKGIRHYRKLKCQCLDHLLDKVLTTLEFMEAKQSLRHENNFLDNLLVENYKFTYELHFFLYEVLILTQIQPSLEIVSLQAIQDASKHLNRTINFEHFRFDVLKKLSKIAIPQRKTSSLHPHLNLPVS